MDKKLIGVATSVSKDKNYDSMDTLEFAKKNNINLVQIYLNDELLGKPEFLVKVTKYAKDNNISLLCHSPEPLNNNVFKNNIIGCANELLKYQGRKKFIIHFDETIELSDSLKFIEELNKKKLCVYLENFYSELNIFTLLRNINIFISIFSITKNSNLSVIPVVDLPRLFINGIANKLDSLIFTKQLFDYLAIHTVSVALHMIDFSDNRQGKSSWTVIGKGLMPYNDIFNFCKTLGISFDHCILEYEDKKLFLDSVKPTENFLIKGV